MFCCLKKFGIDKINFDDFIEEEIGKFVCFDIDLEIIIWRCVLDVNDRYFCGIIIGIVVIEKGYSCQIGFDILVVSECMVIFVFSIDFVDMCECFGRMVVVSFRSGDFVMVDDFGVGGVFIVFMKDVIKFNLMQSLEGIFVFVYVGFFVNIFIGNSFIFVDKMVFKFVGIEFDEDYFIKVGFVIIEVGFDFIMGGECFFNIKCCIFGFVFDVVVVVVIICVFKVYGGGFFIFFGVFFSFVYKEENVEIFCVGCVNFVKYIVNVKFYGVFVVVVINKFFIDIFVEVEVVCEEVIKVGVEDVVFVNYWVEGGKGVVDFVYVVIVVLEKFKDFKFLYGFEGIVQECIEKIVREMYGVLLVEFIELVQKKVEMYIRQGFGNLFICIVKMQYFISYDFEFKGVLMGFIVLVWDVRMVVGVGYLYVLVVDIQMIFGLLIVFGYLNVDVDLEMGEIDGLF